MEWIDISVPIRPGMISFPGDPVVLMDRPIAIDDGAVCNLSRLDFGVHSGTHVDAPVHFIDGAAAAETLPLDVLIGEARVLDLTAAERLDAGAFDGAELGARILLKTRNSELWQRETFAEEF